jgi:hypothetical protein
METNKRSTSILINMSNEFDYNTWLIEELKKERSKNAFKPEYLYKELLKDTRETAEETVDDDFEVNYDISDSSTIYKL